MNITSVTQHVNVVTKGSGGIWPHSIYTHESKGISRITNFTNFGKPVLAFGASAKDPKL